MQAAYSHILGSLRRVKYLCGCF